MGQVGLNCPVPWAFASLDCRRREEAEEEQRKIGKGA
jgi:hypothetical protein